MKKKLNELELKSAHQSKSLIGDVLTLLSQHFGGETTVNHLRIGHYIGLMSLYEREATSNKDISESLSIPRSTVSRITSDCIEKGWVIEKPDPDDGRKKQLVISPKHPEADAFEIDFRRLINQLLRLSEAREVVVVDSDKEGF